MKPLAIGYFWGGVGVLACATHSPWYITLIGILIGTGICQIGSRR